jgi:hypothetical protein
MAVMPAGQRARRPKEPRFVTPADVAGVVHRIGERSRDDVLARSMEYELYRAVIASIAAGAPMARELCEAAIRSQQWGFER